MEECHESIISQEIFDKVQCEIAKRRKQNRCYFKKDATREGGFVLCSYCNRSMAKTKKKYKCNLGHVFILREKVEQAVLGKIYIKASSNKMEENKIDEQIKIENSLLNKIESSNKKIKMLHRQKFNIYESYSYGKISRNEMVVKNQEITQKILKCELKSEELQKNCCNYKKKMIYMQYNRQKTFRE